MKTGKLRPAKCRARLKKLQKSLDKPRGVCYNTSIKSNQRRRRVAGTTPPKRAADGVMAAGNPCEWTSEGRTKFCILRNVVPDGMRARYPARHICVCTERRPVRPQFGWYRGFVGIRPETKQKTLFGAFCLVPQEAPCIPIEKAGGDGESAVCDTVQYPPNLKNDFTMKENRS